MATTDMLVSDFVCYVLRVPAELQGYPYICQAVQYVVDNDGDTGFYKFLQTIHCKGFSTLEKVMRLAKNKALERMREEDKADIFDGKEVSTKEFICYAAQFYRKEFTHENKET